MSIGLYPGAFNVSNKNKEQVNWDDYRQLDGDSIRSIRVPSGKIWFSPKVGDAPLDFNFNANSCQFLKDHAILSFQISQQ